MKVSLMLIMGNIHAVEATLELYGSFSMRQAASLAPSAPHTVPIMPSAPRTPCSSKACSQDRGLVWVCGETQRLHIGAWGLLTASLSSISALTRPAPGTAGNTC